MIFISNKILSNGKRGTVEFDGTIYINIDTVNKKVTILTGEGKHWPDGKIILNKLGHEAAISSSHNRIFILNKFIKSVLQDKSFNGIPLRDFQVNFLGFAPKSGALQNNLDYFPQIFNFKRISESTRNGKLVGNYPDFLFD